jgi:hypothetical protein
MGGKMETYFITKDIPYMPGVRYIFTTSFRKGFNKGEIATYVEKIIFLLYLCKMICINDYKNLK